jgi:hypothetical protein
MKNSGRLNSGRAAELGAIARECHRLALRTGDQTLIAEAKASLAMVAGFEKRDH